MRLGIEYGKAIVDWAELGRGNKSKRYPRISGIVIRRADLAQLETALEEKSKVRQEKIAELPVLVALFTLNRRAKRCRDLAQTHYQRGMHGLAGKMKREKNRIHDLKGQVLHHMLEAGILVGGKFHIFEHGNWAEVLEGGKYRFHRPSPPGQSLTETVLLDSIEAKPKDAKEPTLEIAYEVVMKYLLGKSHVNVYEWPRLSRNRRKYNWHEEDEDDEEL